LVRFGAKLVKFTPKLVGSGGEVAELRTQQVAMAKKIAALDQRLTSLEEKVDSRLKETRPIWEAVRAQIEKLDEKFNLFIRDLYETRSDIWTSR
jgi:predicted  nucleic acid-binding Zn-ribbon protein